MSYLDIAFLALIVLFAIVGVWKGFIKSAIGMFGWIVALLIAFFCAKPLAEWLAGGVCKGIVTGDKSLYTFFYGKLPEAVVSLPAGASAEEIAAALGSGVFAALIKPFVSLFTSSEFMATSATVGEGVALVLANTVFALLCGIVLFILVRILMSLFGRFASSAIDSSRVLTTVNRFLGLLLGAARGALYACVLLFCAGFFTGFGFMDGYNRELDKSTICKPVSEYVAALPEKILNDDDWFSELLENAGLGDKAETPDEGTPDGETPDEGTPDDGAPDAEQPGTEQSGTEQPDGEPETETGDNYVIEEAVDAAEGI